MIVYLTKRLLSALLIIWGVLTVTFFLLHIAPGSPTDRYLRPDIDPAVVANIQKQLGLDRPLPVQYGRWLARMVQGNWGVSFSHQRPVLEVFAEAIPNTLTLTAAAFFLQLVFGIVAGLTAAARAGGPVDRLIQALTLVSYSLPAFWLALMAVYLFAFKLRWFPTGQMMSLTTFDSLTAVILDRAKHLVLPATILAVPLASHTARLVRAAALEVVHQEWMLFARAMGMGRLRRYGKYALKPALLPLISMTSSYLPFLFGGAVVIEVIFSWPGMGRITVEAMFSHDDPVVLASTFVAAATVVFGNLLADVLYGLADPRIRVKAHG